MTVALWIIAICEVVRIIQLALQFRHDNKAKSDVYGEFIRSLKTSDREWVREVLERYENDGTGESD